MKDSAPRAVSGLELVVLLVDDYDDTRELFALVLESAGFKVIQAATGVDGLELARELLPRLIVTDISLPDIDGFELTRRLKGNERTSGIPVVALSAHGSLAKMQEALEAGCATFISKSRSPRHLVEELRRQLL